VERDEILRQGMDIAAKLRDVAGAQVAEHEPRIREAVAKVAEFVNTQTAGQYREQVGRATGYVEMGVAWLAEAGRDGAQPPPS
jgi:hypothetical protein